MTTETTSHPDHLLVYYARLSEERIAILNGPEGGWGCADWSRAYAELSMIGKRDDDPLATAAKIAAAARLGIYHLAARLHEAELPHAGRMPTAEAVWTVLQNLTAAGWPDQLGPTSECKTDFPRSMDLGDVIVFPDGRAAVCAAFGFVEIAAAPFLTALEAK